MNEFNDTQIVAYLDARPARAARLFRMAVAAEQRASEVADVSRQADLLERAHAFRMDAFRLRDEMAAEGVAS